MSDLKVFREKTIARIIDRKREYQQRGLQEKEEDKKVDTAFRRHWLEEFRQKRAKEIVEAVDKHIVSSSIPDALSDSKVSFRYKKAENEEHLRQLTSDLEDLGTDHVQVKRDSGQYTMAIQNKTEGASALFEFKSGEKKSVADYFLRSAVATQYHRRLKLRMSLGDALSSHNSSVHSMIDTKTGSAKCAKTNEAQIDDLLKQLYEAPVEPGYQRKFLGNMKRVLALAQRTSWSNIRLAADPHAAPSSSQPLPGKDSGHTLPPEHEKYSSNSFRTALVDGCYLLGPDKRTIVDFVRSKRAATVVSSGDDSSLAGSATGSTGELKRSASVRGKISEDAPFRTIAEPQLLFHTDGDEPQEMGSLLPSYCFPSGVEIVASLLTDPNRARPGTSMAAGDKTRKGKKKMRVFFPSEYSLHGDNSASVHEKDHQDSLFSLAVPVLPSVVTTFVILIGDHSNQRFGVCLQIPVSFVDPELGVSIETYYTLCILTRFPFHNYFFYVIFKLDEEKKLFAFHEPLPLFDRNFPFHPDLRGIDELINKLRKLVIPIFPYFIMERGNQMDSAPKDAQAAPAASESYFAYYPNIHLTLKLKNAEVDMLDLFRGYYQMFYTNIGHPVGEHEASLLDLATRSFDKTMLKSFVPTLPHRQEREKEETFFILQWALPTLLKHLPLDQIVLALGCLVSEMVVIVQHHDSNVISGVILALMQLLKPLKWCSPVIVTLPESLNEAMESPVPIILGVQKLPSTFVLLENYVVVDPANRIVHLNPSDVVKSHTILLPNASRVVHALTSHKDVITSYTRKQKNSKYKKLSMTHSFYTRNLSAQEGNADAAGETAKDAATASARDDLKLKLNVPLELQVNTADCAQYLGAIQAFSNIVYNHILAIVNTTIQIQHDEQRAAKSKRRIVKPARPSTGANTPPKTAVSPAPAAGVPSPIPPSSTVTAPASPLPPLPVTLEHSPVSLMSAEAFSPQPALGVSSEVAGTQMPPPVAFSGLITTGLPTNTSSSPTSEGRASLDGTVKSSHSAHGSRRNKTGGHRQPSPTSARLSVSPPRPGGPAKRDRPVPYPGRAHGGDADLSRKNLTSMGSMPAMPRRPHTSRNSSPTSRPKSGDPVEQRPRSLPRGMKPGISPVRNATEVADVLTAGAAPEPSQPVSEDTPPPHPLPEFAPPLGASLGPSATIPSEVTVPIGLVHPNLMETMSDVTSTDIGRDAIDEKSVGPAASVSASVSSGASSLPSLASDAPMLALKDIGQGGLKFVKKLVETQMYSNYCQWNKVSPGPSLDNAACRLPNSPVPPQALIPAAAVLGARSDELGEDTIEESADALLDVFSIMLTGSIIDPAHVEHLRDSYERLYGPQPQSAQELVGSIADCALHGKSSSRYAAVTHKASKSSRHMRNYINAKVIPRLVKSESSPARFLEEDFLSCNGLLCHGFCNTALCGEICANIWEKKVQILRRQQAAYDILTKRYEKVDKSSESQYDVGSSTKIEYITAAGARLEASKHGRETPSQYALRRQVIACSITTSTSLREPADGHRNVEHLHSHKGRHVGQNHGQTQNQVRKKARYFERKVRGVVFEGHGLRPRTFAHCADPYTLALAAHFAKKEEKVNAKYRRRCYARVERFVLKFVVFMRKIKFHHSVRFLQAAIRGFLVRASFDALFTQLIDRKRRRFMAALLLRNFVRNRYERVLYICERREEEQVRKRRASSQIPVGTKTKAGAGDAVSASHEATIAATAAAPAPMETSSSKVPPGKAPLPVLSTKFLHEPTLDLRAQPNAAVGRRHIVPGIALPPNSPPSLPDAEARSAEQHPFSADPDSLETLPHVAKKSGMAERAREFLQFGIARRSSFAHNKNVRRSLDSTHSIAALNAALEKDKQRDSDGENARDKDKGRKGEEHDSENEKEKRPSISISSLFGSSAAFSPDKTKRPDKLSSPSSSSSKSNSSIEAPAATPSPPALVPATIPLTTAGVVAATPSPGHEAERVLPSGSTTMENDYFEALLSPALFPVITDEYDSNDEEGVVVSSSAEEKLRRKTRFSRRFSASDTNWTLSSTDPSTKLERADTSGSGASQRLKGVFDSAEEGEQHQQQLLRRKPNLAPLDVQPLSSPLTMQSLPSARSKDSDTLVSAGGYGAESDNDNRSAAHSRYDPPSDEETIVSATPSTATTASRVKRSTPFGRYAANNNIALQNFSSVRTPRARPSAYDLPSGSASASYDAALLEESHRRGLHPPVPDGKPGGKSRRSLLTAGRASLSGSASPLPMSMSTQSGLMTELPAIGEEDVPSVAQSTAPPIPVPSIALPSATAEGGKEGTPSPSQKQLDSRPSSVESMRKPKVEVVASEAESGDEEAADTSHSSRRVGDDMDTELQLYPLKTLGHAAAELLNRQQMTIIKRMYKLLRGGASVIKHGRNGAPKQKALLCDVALRKIYWRNPGSKPEPAMDDEGGAEGAGDSSGEEQSLLRPLFHSRRRSMFGRKDARRASLATADSKRMLVVADILSVADDCSSDVLHRSLGKGYLTNPSTYIITVAVAGRTLDLEVEEAIWADLFHGLQILVNYYQMLLPGRHTSVGMDSDLHYVKRHLRHDSIASVG